MPEKNNGIDSHTRTKKPNKIDIIIIDNVCDNGWGSFSEIAQRLNTAQSLNALASQMLK